MRGDEEVPELDPERHPPELLAYFLDQRARWLRGEIRLEDHVEAHRPNGDPLWYPRPLDDKVIVDKSALFDRLGYRPSGPACRAHASRAKVRVFSGGARCGKSLWAGRELLPLLLSPDCRIWLVAPEYDQARKEFGYLLEAIESDEIRRDWGPMIDAGRIANRPKHGDMEILLRWQDAAESFVRVKSAKMPTSLLSEELDAVCLVEASQIPERIWSRYLQMRLTTRRGIALLPSSPDGVGWFQALHDVGLAGRPGHFTINADSRTNPTIDLDEVAFWTSRDMMSDEDFDEQVRGRPTPRHGRILKEFSRAIHVDPWQDDWPPEGAELVRGFDFGFSNPTAVVWIARAGETFYLYRELYRARMVANDVVREIARIEGWDLDESDDVSRLVGSPRREKMDLASVADSAAASERAELAARGIRTRKAKKDVDAGIRTLSELLRVRSDGRPRLFVSPRCPNWIREAETWQWGPGGRPKDDQSDHALDASRYVLHTIAPQHRARLEIREVGV